MIMDVQSVKQLKYNIMDNVLLNVQMNGKKMIIMFVFKNYAMNNAEKNG